MPPIDAFVYPALLLAVYGIYRVGGDAPRSVRSVFEWSRAFALAVFLALAALLQWRMLQLGELRGPVGVAASVLSIGAIAALLVLQLLRLAGYGIDAVDDQPISSASPTTIPSGPRTKQRR